MAGDTSNAKKASATVALVRARAALDRVTARPDESAAIARTILEDRPREASEVVVVAMFALGRASHELGEISLACQVLARAASMARLLGLTEDEAHIRSSLALSRFTAGDAEGAFADLDFAESHLDGADRARVTMQRAIVLVHSGDLNGGLEAFTRALPSLEDGGDDLAAMRLVTSRGVVHSLLGDLDAAERDLIDAERRALILDETMVCASIQGNLAFVYGRRGDVPLALDWFERSRSSYSQTGEPGRLMAILDTDLCEVLLLAGLEREAEAAARRALAIAESGDNVVQAAEAKLLLARTLLVAGDHELSEREASEAARMFREAGRHPWSAQARHVELQARSENSESPDTAKPNDMNPDAVSDALAIVDELADNGWELESLQARTMLARSLLDRGEVEGARGHLAVAAAARSRGTVDQRVHAWYAAALLALADGDRRSARRALSSGMRVLDHHQLALGATELRVRSAVHSTTIHELGIELALEAGRPADVLVLTERARASSLRSPAARPPLDHVLASFLVELRRLDADRHSSVLGGESAESILHEQAAIERKIQRHARLARGTTKISGPFAPAALRSRLDDRFLVEFVESSGDLYAVVVNARRTRLRPIGRTADVEAQIRRLLFALRRLAAGRGSPASLADAWRGLARSAEVLDDLLLTGLGAAAEVVVVPSRVLRALPWSVLPSAVNRPISVAPSAAVWMRERDHDDVGREVVLVAGPDLPGAAHEINRLRSVYVGCTVLDGEAATAEAALEAAQITDILHIAAHGTFRADSPLFSSVHLADGPLTVYDWERMVRAPTTVVLSACHGAASDDRAGDETVGTAAALIGQGVRTIIAPVMAIGDEPTAEVMVALHRELAAGLEPPAALARVLDQTASDHRLGAVSRAFVVISADCRA